MTHLSWPDVLRQLDADEPGRLVRIPRTWVEHPLLAGLRPSMDLPRGQIGTYVRVLDAHRWVQVTEYVDFYVAKLIVRQQVSEPAVCPRTDDAGATLGFLVGLVLGGTVAAAIVGLALGAFAETNADASVRTARCERAATPARRATSKLRRHS